MIATRTSIDANADPKSIGFIFAEYDKKPTGILKINKELSEKDLRKLCKKLRARPSIKELHLVNCDINKKGIHILIEGYLRNNDHLIKLDLSENQIDLSGANALLKVIDSTCLQIINLDYNLIDRQDLADNVVGDVKQAIYRELEFNKRKPQLDTPKRSSISEKKSETDTQPQNQENASLFSSVGNTVVKSFNASTQWIWNMTTPPNTARKSSVTRLKDKVEQLTQVVDITRERVNQHDEKFSSLEKIINKHALQLLDQHLQELANLINKESKSQVHKNKRKSILSDPVLSDYYLTVLRHLTGTWLACMTISSGCVSNGMQNTSDYVTRALDGIGGLIPGVNIATRIISGIIQANNFVDKNRAVANMSAFFTDIETASRVIKKLALTLTEMQQDVIKTTKNSESKGMKARAKKWFASAKNWALADGSNNPVVALGLADCAKLLEAIMTGSIKKTNNVKSLTTVILDEQSKAKVEKQKPASVSASHSHYLATTATIAVAIVSQRQSPSLSEVQREIAKLKQESQDAKHEAEQARQESQNAKHEAEQARIESRNASEKAKKLEEQLSMSSGNTQALAFELPRKRSITLYGDENSAQMFQQVKSLLNATQINHEMLQSIEQELAVLKDKKGHSRPL